MPGTLRSRPAIASIPKGKSVRTRNAILDRGAFERRVFRKGRWRFWRFRLPGRAWTPEGRGGDAALLTHLKGALNVAAESGKGLRLGSAGTLAARYRGPERVRVVGPGPFRPLRARVPPALRSRPAIASIPKGKSVRIRNAILDRGAFERRVFRRGRWRFWRFRRSAAPGRRKGRGTSFSGPLSEAPEGDSERSSGKNRSGLWQAKRPKRSSGQRDEVEVGKSGRVGRLREAPCRYPRFRAQHCLKDSFGIMSSTSQGKDWHIGTRRSRQPPIRCLSENRTGRPSGRNPTDRAHL